MHWTAWKSLFSNRKYTKSKYISSNENGKESDESCFSHYFFLLHENEKLCIRIIYFVEKENWEKMWEFCVILNSNKMRFHWNSTYEFVHNEKLWYEIFFRKRNRCTTNIAFEHLCDCRLFVLFFSFLEFKISMMRRKYRTNKPNIFKKNRHAYTHTSNRRTHLFALNFMPLNVMCTLKCKLSEKFIRYIPSSIFSDKSSRNSTNFIQFSINYLLFSTKKTFQLIYQTFIFFLRKFTVVK